MSFSRNKTKVKLCETKIDLCKRVKTNDRFNGLCLHFAKKVTFLCVAVASLLKGGFEIWQNFFIINSWDFIRSPNPLLEGVTTPSYSYTVFAKLANLDPLGVSEFVQFVLLWHNFEGCTLQFGSVGGPWLFGEGVAILSCLSSQHSFSDQNIYLSYGYGNCPAKNMILSWRNTLDEIALPLPKHS